jgi:peptide deformylase
MKLNNNDVVTDDNPIMRETSLDVNLPLNKENKEMLLAMYEGVKLSTSQDIEDINKLKPASGLAAIQIGYKKNMLVAICEEYDKNDNLIHYEFALVNPKIISRSVQLAALKNGEGCLSVTDFHEGYVYRNARVRIKAYDLLQDKEINIRARGYLAIVLQHELDHLNGILYYDHINKKDPYYTIEGAEIIG